MEVYNYKLYLQFVFVIWKFMFVNYICNLQLYERNSKHKYVKSIFKL